MLWQSNRSYEENRESIVAVDVGLAYWVSGADIAAMQIEEWNRRQDH